MLPTRRALRRSLIALGAVMLALGACGPGPTPPPAIEDPVTIRVVVDGPGRVTYGFVPLDCRSDCTWEVPGDQSISVQAIPSSGNVFASWSGDCDALPNPCTRTFDDGDTITATFAPHALRFDLTGDGEGTFAISGGGIATSCDGDCGVPLTQPLQLAISYQSQGTTGTTLGDWTGPCEPATLQPGYCLVQVSGATEIGKSWTHPPVAFPDAYEMDWETTLAVAAPGVLGNDVDTPGDTHTAQLVTGVAHGGLSLASNGGFTYTPDDDFFGTDGFTYRARDAFGNLSNTAGVTITVVQVNRAPVASDVAYEVDQDATLVVDAADGVLKNDTDPDGDALTAILETDAEHGTLALEADGGFTYAPDEGYEGLDTFTYRASDGELESEIATVTITVTAVTLTAVPTAVDDNYRTTRNTVLTVAAPGVLANDLEGDGTPLSADLATAARHGTLSLDADGGIRYTPARGFVGRDDFTYRAVDATNASDPATVSIEVAAR